MKMNVSECHSHGLGNLLTTQKILHQIIFYFLVLKKLWKMIFNIIIFFSKLFFEKSTFSGKI